METQLSEAPVLQAESEPDAYAGADVFVIPRVIFNYVAIAVAFFAVGVVVGILATRSGSSTGVAAFDEAAVSNMVREAVNQALNEYTAARQPPRLDPNQTYVVTTSGEDPFMGADDAKVTMIEFSDFRCSYCARFAAETLPLIVQNYGDRVRFVYRDYPQFGELSEQAAMAAQCANDQGKFWEYHNLLFKNQQGLTDAAVMKQLAADLGLNMDTFNSCFDGQVYKDEVAADFQEGQKYAQIGTPTFFINGKPVIGAQPYDVFAQLIEQQLAAAQTAG